METLTFDLQRFAIDNYDSYTLVTGTAYADDIWNNVRDGVTINAGAGNDTIRNWGNYGKIDAGAGNDSIYSFSDYATITGGTGNDTVSLYGGAYTQNNLIKYSSGDDNDIIYNFSATDTLSITGDSYTSVTSGSDVVLTIGNGKITLKGATGTTLNIKGTYGSSTISSSGIYASNYNANSLISGTSGNDSIYNYGSNVTMNGGTGNDYLVSFDDGSKVTLTGGAGNDTIHIWSNNSRIDGGDGNDHFFADASYSTVIGGAGNDSVENYATNVSISGGAGNDTIKNTSIGNYSTINGGAGNDIISLSSYGKNNVIQYATGDGNDTVYNIGTTDTITISGSYTRSTVGNDVVLNVGSGSIKLVGAKGKTLNISPSNPTPTPTPTLPSSVINNYTKNSLVSGSSSNDTIYNYAGGATVRGNGGNDYIYNSTNSDYTINNGYGYVTLDGGDGNDTIKSCDPRVSINGGAGADLISLPSYSYSKITVKGGTGNDTIYGDGGSLSSGVLYQYAYGDGNDIIYNYSATDSITITGGDTWSTTTSGSDVILTAGSGKITLKGANGKTLNIYPTILPVIYNYNKNSLVSSSTSNDTIYNYAGGATVRGNGGNDYIYNSTNSDYTINNGYGYVTLDGGDGNDTIKSYDPRVSLSGGAGADVISLYSSGFTGVTVNAGTGNDTIYGDSLGGGVLYQYKLGDGNDLIYNWSANDTLSISGGSYTTTTSGNNILVNIAGGGTVTLNGAKGKTPIIYPTISPVMYNYNKNSLVSGSSSNDTIYNYAGGATVRSNSGNDYIYNSTNTDYTINGVWGYVTIDGGEGNDTIKSYDPRVSLSGGAGADLISLYSSGFSNVTINGGIGNDTIYGDSLGGGVLYQYKLGDGNDLIYGYDSKDSITITGGSWSTTTSGNDVILTAGSGKVTLKGAKGKTLNIYPSLPTPTPTPTPTPVSNVTPQEVIKKFMKSLDTTSESGRRAVDEAIKAATGGYFQNTDAAITAMISDCRTTNNATKFLSDYCDIDLTNTDTGAITGKDAGGANVKTAQSVVSESGNVDTSFTGNSFTTNGLTVQLSSFDFYGNNSNITYDRLPNAKQKYIWQALETWWVKGAINLISLSYGSNYGFGSGATGKKLNFGFYNENSGTMAVTTGWYADNAHKTIGKLDMKVNMTNYDKIIVGDADGKISGKSGFQLDRVLAHEFTHALMYVNINYAGDLPDFIMEGMAELTHGVDDDRKSELTTLAKNPSALSTALNFDCYDSYAGGYMFLRYLAKQGSLHYPSSAASNLSALQSKSLGSSSSSSAISLSGTTLTVSKSFNDNKLDLSKYSSAKTINTTVLSKGIMIVGNKNPLSISAGTGSDSVFANVGNDTVNGGAGNDILHGEAGNDVLKGDAGNDSINGGTGNDTLTGGAGNDIFIFGTNSGNDVITDYTAGQDKIRLADGSISRSSVSGSDVILTGSRTGSITLKGGKDKNITVIDGNGKETTKKYTTTGSNLTDTTPSASTTLTVTKDVTLTSAYANADASKLTKAVKITGNNKANSILGGKGADTLWGGTGNDTLKGNGGNDIFVYSAGKDVITDYATGDKISLGAAVSKATVSGSDVVFTIGTGSLTVKNGKGKSLSMIDKAGKAYTTVVGGSTTSTLKTVTNTDKSPLTIDAAIKTVDASKRTSAVKITGNGLDNVLLGGSKNDSLYGGNGNDSILGNAGNDKLYGEAGNDTLRGGAGNDSLWGGAGNDSLWGDAGNDTFIYDGQGKDVFFGVENNDLLQITGTFSGTYNSSKKEIYFKVGSTANALTLKDFTATTFNINGANYGISGSKVVKK